MNSLLSGISGLQAHQTMLDVAGNNLANVNTSAFKSSRVTFSDLLSQTLQQAGSPSATTGGTNPMQVGSGVQVASIDRNMTQGALMNTGQPLDMAIDGAGYFVLQDGKGESVYTRVGNFAVDSNFNLVDPGTGNLVQRYSIPGDTDFQDAGNKNIRIPYDRALPAKPTTSITYAGNLSADDLGATTTLLTSGTQYTKSGGAASADTLLADLDQAIGLTDGCTVEISGTRRDGSTVAGSYAVSLATSTLGELTDAITAAFADPSDPTQEWSTASISNGEIRLTDSESGYSLTDMNLVCTDGTTDLIDFPTYFQMLSAGGNASRSTNIEIYDGLGNSHVMSAAFVRTDTLNTWDMVLTSLSGDVTLQDRRIEGIAFDTNGSFDTVKAGEESAFRMTFMTAPTEPITVDVKMGTQYAFDGLSQFGGSSTAAPSGQDGYSPGWLSSISVTNEGVLTGVFTNGIRRDLAALQVATFQNPAGMPARGNNYFAASANSGDPMIGMALEGSAGGVRAGALEKSNVDVATEFVNLIQAQNGFQANARTIKAANDMLQVLTNSLG